MVPSHLDVCGKESDTAVHKLFIFSVALVRACSMEPRELI